MPDLIYSRKATNETLDYNDLMRLAPAAFSEQPIEGVSDRYGHYSTVDAINQLRSQGWKPVQAAQSRARTKQAQAHTKHLIAFARDEDMHKSEGRPEIVLYNSSDRTSSLKLYAGFFRWICSNSCIMGSGSEVKIYHTKHKIQGFEDLLDQTIQNIDRGEEMRLEMMERSINWDQLMDLGNKAAALRWRSIDSVVAEDPEIEIPNGSYFSALTAGELFTRRRYGEEAFTAGQPINLWSAFQRAQEGLMRGGVDILSITKKCPSGAIRRARAIQNVKEAIRINRDVFDIFEAA